VCTVALAVTAERASQNLAVGLVMLACGLVALTVYGAYLHRTRRWTAFTPGVLIGVRITCLLPVGVVALLCAAHP
jgi:hypothetical protein